MKGYPLSAFRWDDAETPFMPLGVIQAGRIQMNVTESIATLFLEKDADVQELALLLSDIHKALTDFQLTEQEYVGLMGDVERLKMIIKLSQTQELNLIVNQAIFGIIELAKTVKF